ncbi:rhamnulokinase [Microterricola pindariensis]|uniref:Rhamnulokinase n=1 Tax=Microterricola pindariensis TaxID=478010 RepID=A0ABX5AX08_9MICO|nr:rhamnulokinase family protein [Microterricola pindariensis]PPL18919.1 rhamnulokinase [Microterricola pindariensis]
MNAFGRVAALDFGATSGRVIVGEVSKDQLRMQTFARFANRPVAVGGRLHWDVLALWQDALDGVAAAIREVPDLTSVATDTWGVDYGLFRGGRLLANPTHYRDERTNAVVAGVNARMPEAEQYRRAGIQILPINTIYQFAAEAEDQVVEWADSALLMPDLFTYWLSGARIAERTMASTTGLLDAHSREWNAELVAAAGIPMALLPALVDAGTAVGPLRADVARAVGAAGRVEVVAVGSHDTASAVVAVPMESESAAFISCGTWGLVGVERSHPVLSEEARLAGFTNEAGVDGRYLLMHNVMGLWILTEAVRQWERHGETVELQSLLAAAAAVSVDLPVFDVNDARFLPPGDMPARITGWCIERGLTPPQNLAEMTRCIIESLACAFADAAQRAGSLGGVAVQRIHIVGGGCQNELLCQRTADRAGLPVLAGPVEATALGNILVQARTMGHIAGDLDELRDLVRRTNEPVRYEPR